MFTNIQYRWNRGHAWSSAKIKKIRNFWSEEGPGGDGLWWMDVLMLLGGIRAPLTSNWTQERKIRITLQILFGYTIYVFYVQLFEGLNKNKPVSIVIMEVTKVTSISISCVRMVSLALLAKPITTLRCFITSNSVCSGDAEYDERERRKFNQYARRSMQFFFSWIAMDTVLFSIPTEDDLFSFPRPASWIGENAWKVVNTLFVSMIPTSVLPKTIGCTACVGVILMGMRTKLRLVAHRLEMISQQQESDEEQYFERVSREVREALEQHLEYLNHFALLENIMGKVFLLVHYFSVFAVGAMFYACHEVPIGFMTLIFAAAVSFFLLEYFLLCHLVDSLQDEADAIGQHLFDLCAQIPFRPEWRSEYVQMRTTLMIIWLNTRNRVAMNCMGIFEINTPKFVALINVAYSVLTFLIQMGPERRSEYVQMRTTLMIIWLNTRNRVVMNCMGMFEINTPKFVALINVAYSVLTFLIQMG